MRKRNGNLHFFINGLDQGVAATRVPAQMWGVVDLYGMVVKVTIVDRDDREAQNLVTRRNFAQQPTTTRTGVSSSTTAASTAEVDIQTTTEFPPDAQQVGVPTFLFKVSSNIKYFKEIFSEFAYFQPDDNRLLFHPQCGTHATVINGGITSHRFGH